MRTTAGTAFVFPVRPPTTASRGLCLLSAKKRDSRAGSPEAVRVPTGRVAPRTLAGPYTVRNGSLGSRQHEQRRLGLPTEPSVDPQAAETLARPSTKWDVDGRIAGLGV